MMITVFKNLLIPLSLIILLSGCSNGPSDTAKEFLGDMASGKVSKASQLATEDTAKLILMASSFGKIPVDPDFNYQLINEKIDGNRAIVTYKSNPKAKVKILHLVKLDGTWKVHENKH